MFNDNSQSVTLKKVLWTKFMQTADQQWVVDGGGFRGRSGAAADQQWVVDGGGRGGEEERERGRPQVP